MNKLVNCCIRGGAVSFLALTLGAVQASAQETAAAQDADFSQDGSGSSADGQGDAIIVTGSRIPRANFETAQPIVVLGGDQIAQRGYTNIADALEELPAFGVPGSSPIGTGQSGEFGSGQNFANFFGLGDQRTLTIVNGRRFVSSNTASIFGPTGNGSQVDLNVIPTMMIDRIETVAVGGAPIYGSDAIAGTINIITKRDFQGLKLDGQYGLSSRGDAREYRLGVAAGTNFADGRGNIAFFGEYNKTQGMLQSDRASRRTNSFFTTPGDPSAPYANGYIADRRIPSISQYGIPGVSDGFYVVSPSQAVGVGQAFGLPFPLQVGITDDATLTGNPMVFNRAGELVPIDFGVEAGDVLTSDGGNGFALPGSLRAPVRRLATAALAQYELTDAIRVFGEGWYANTKGTQFTGQPEYNSVLFGSAGQPGGNFILSIDNPYLSDQARSIIAANLAANPLADDPSGQTFLLGRANTDLISGIASSTTELYRFVGGIDGKFEAFGRQMTFDATVNYGNSTIKGNGRAIVQQNLVNALNAVEVGGQIVCAPGGTNSPMPTISSVCAPINPFGQNISQAARDYVTAITDPVSKADQLVFTASVGGSLFDVWGGPVGFAIGYEHRRETTSIDPGAYFRGGDDPDPLTDDNGDGIPDNDRVPYGSSVTMDAVSGKFHTNEVFAELTVPLISADQNIPLIRAFSLNGAFRYIDHSLAGGDPTYTIGATWDPVEHLTVRGNFTRSVRSPAITEFFNPRAQIFTTAQDPCDPRFINGGPNPAVRQANCATLGLDPAFTSTIVGSSQPGTFSGNPDLVNEKANAWTIGLILHPRFLPGFNLSVDWVNIKVKDAIEGLSATNIMNACYDSPDFPNAASGSGVPFCELFVRDTTGVGLDRGQVLSIDTGYQNAAQRHFEGLVADLDWRFATPFLGAESSLRLGVKYLYNHRLDLKVGVGDITTLATSMGYSKHQATTNLTYANKGFAWQWQAQYMGKAYNDPDAPLTDYQYPIVKDVVFFNSSMGYQVNDNFRLSLIVDNVFDTKPPFPAPANGGTVTYFDGIMGRYMRVGASVTF